MRISDWSSDVCSSDLHGETNPANHGDGIDLQPCRAARPGGKAGLHRQPDRRKDTELLADEQARRDTDGHGGEYLVQDRKSVVSGKSVSVSVNLGGRRIIKNKEKKQ